ncbi:MAG: M64 family metallo-endopeptidase [Gammaproteobacteria bacterium]|nr:M64 family metallo-endopeptidase [Gammaproteobacteria bacterium]
MKNKNIVESLILAKLFVIMFFGVSLIACSNGDDGAEGTKTQTIIENTDEGGGDTPVDPVDPVVQSATAPTAEAKAYNTTKGMSINTVMDGSSPTGTLTAFTIVKQPDNGVLTGMFSFPEFLIASIVYEPNSGFIGDDNFTYTVTNELGEVSLPATVALKVNDVAPTTLLQGRSDGKGIDLVIIADAFTASEIPTFQTKAQEVVDKIFSYNTTLTLQKNSWNVHRIDTVSISSNLEENTALETNLGCDQYSATTLCVSPNTLQNAVSAVVPQYEFIIVIVNGPYYRAAASGKFMALPVGGDPGATAVHELGHAFAGLADEYIELTRLVNTPTVEPIAPNITINNNLSTVKWKHWLDDPFIGLYEGGYYLETGVWRPALESFMRVENRPIHSVSQEAWTLALYKRLKNGNQSGTYHTKTPVGSPINANETDISHALGDSVTYSVELSIGTTAQKVDWYVDDVLVLENSLSFSHGALETNNYKVTASISDTTNTVRNDVNNYSSGLINWFVTLN